MLSSISSISGLISISTEKSLNASNLLLKLCVCLFESSNCETGIKIHGGLTVYHVSIV